MTLEALASGALGALLVFVLGFGREWWLKNNRIGAYQGALRAEITECGRIAGEYGPAGVAAPLYRLPTICYVHSLPGLLGEGVIGENEADALVKFYAEVETFNRGLDLADLMRGDEEALNAEVGRILLKAKKIATSSGSLYVAALAAV